MKEAILPPNEIPKDENEKERDLDQEGGLKKIWTGFRNRISNYSFEDSRLGRMKDKAIEQIEKLSQSDRIKFLDGISRIGNSVEGYKNSKMAAFSIGMANTFENKHVKKFFQENADHYEERMSQAYGDAQEKDLKDMARVRGVGRGIAGNFIRATRILSDVTQANPFRHVMAGSMFVGHNAEMVKKVRLKSESAMEKTRVDDFDQAFEEANRLYEMAQKDIKNGEVDTQSLEEAYEKNLPKDVLDRFSRGENFEGLSFLERGMAWHMKKGAEKIEKQLEKIDNSDLDETEKEQKRQAVYARNKKLLEDLDGMVGDQGTIDTFAYVSRNTEKTGKAVAMAMTIESIPRIVKMVGSLAQTGMEWTGSTAEASELKNDDRLNIWKKDHSLDEGAIKNFSAKELQDTKKGLDDEYVGVKEMLKVVEKTKDQEEVVRLKVKLAEIDHKLHSLIEPIREKMKIEMGKESAVTSQDSRDGDNQEVAQDGTVEEAGNEVKSWYKKYNGLMSEKKDLEKEIEKLDKEGVSTTALRQQIQAIDKNLVQLKDTAPHAKELFGDDDSEVNQDHEVLDNDSAAAIDERGNIELKPEKEASARDNKIMENVEEGHFEIPENVEVKRGDSIWSVTERCLKENDIFKRLVDGINDKEIIEALETHNTDRVKDLIVASPQKYGIPEGVDVDKMNIKQLQGVKWQKAFDDAFSVKGLTEGLTDEQVGKIVDNNERLKIFFTNDENKDIPRTSENYMKVLKGDFDGGDVNVPPEELEVEIEDFEEAQVDQVENFDASKEPELVKKFSEGWFATQKQFEQEWPVIKNMSAQDAIDAKFSFWTNNDAFDQYLKKETGKKYIGNQIDGAEISNRKKMQELLRAVQKEIGQPQSGETIESFLGRYYGAEEVVTAVDAQSTPDVTPVVESVPVEVAESPKSESVATEQIEPVVSDTSAESTESAYGFESFREPYQKMIKDNVASFFDKSINHEKRIDNLVLQLEANKDVDGYKKGIIDHLKSQGVAINADNTTEVELNLLRLLEGSASEKQEARRNFGITLQLIDSDSDKDPFLEAIRSGKEAGEEPLAKEAKEGGVKVINRAEQDGEEDNIQVKNRADG